MTPSPITGAWLPGMPLGRRQLLQIATDRPLALEAGGHLRDVTIAYETWGRLDATASNAVLVCHAWTGDSHAHGAAGHGHPTSGWWDDVVGPGLAIDTERYFVVCANVLGGCQGSTGPSSTDPATGRRYGSHFPVVTVRDMVRAQARLADHLGVVSWHSVVGGSMGGMQVLEWGITFPRRVRSLVPIATCLQSTAQQIALTGIGKRAIMQDPAFRGGDYYDGPDGPLRGLALARQVAQVSFRSDTAFSVRFGRDTVEGHDALGLWDRFEIERYLDYHGDKLVRRFDANSYLTLGKSMDLHDVGRSRNGVEAAVRRIQVPVLTVAVRSDILYPSYQQRQIRDVVLASGGTCEYVEIDSDDGHDGFLIAGDQVSAALGPFLDRIDKDDQ
jgi:homoserine O-acetyltransferase/O-succinyltransferase